jgi:hypothetical protein
MGETKKTASRPDQMRISLVFHMDDPLEKAAYELLSAKTVKKSRSHLVSQAVLGFMYLDDKSLLDTYTIKSIVEKAARETSQQLFEKLVAEGLPMSTMTATPSQPTKVAPVITFEETPAIPILREDEPMSEKQSAAIDDMLANFMNF